MICWRLFPLLVFVLSIALTITTEIPDTKLTFTVGGFKRYAIPVNESTNQSLRLAVLGLHGGKGNAEEQRSRSGFDAIAVAEGFAVIYVQGIA